MEYRGKTILVAVNDSLLQSLQKPKLQKSNDIVVYKVKEILEKQTEIDDILAIDCGSLYLNKQHNITEFLKNNLSLAEIKATQQMSIDAARHNFETRLVISPSYKNYYGIGYDDKNIRISDAIKEGDQVGVLLAGVANDLMASVWADPISYMKAKIPFFDKSIIKRSRILKEQPWIRRQVIDGLKRNMEQILGINSQAKICTYGIFLPQILPPVFEDIFLELNYEIELAAITYGQSYIDISDTKTKKADFHPTPEGYVIIAYKVAMELSNRFSHDKIRYAIRGETFLHNFVQDLIDKGFDRKYFSGIEIEPFAYETRGLDGAIEDTRRYAIREQEFVENFVQYLIDIGYDKKYINQIMKKFVDGRLDEVKTMEKIYTRSKSLVR